MIATSPSIVETCCEKESFRAVTATFGRVVDSYFTLVANIPNLILFEVQHFLYYS